VLNKVLLEPKLAVTQTAASVKQLIEFVSGKPCQEMPAVFKLANGVQLNRSSKGDAYYVTSKQGCSCKAGQFGRVCKHRTPLLEGDKPIKSAAELYQEKQRARRAAAKALPPVDSIMPRDGKFTPVLE